MRAFLNRLFAVICCLFLMGGVVVAQSEELQKNIYNPGTLKPRDSTLKVKAGQLAPDFTLPSVSGKKISLSDYRGKRNVVISFVPAAFTPVCSDQWPGYNIVKDMFDESGAILLGITVDNIPTLHAWTRQMGKLWFEVLSDFWPHGAVADKYGVLRRPFRTGPDLYRQARDHQCHHGYGHQPPTGFRGLRCRVEKNE